MATIKIRIPSKKIAFGFLEIEGDAEELGFNVTDPHEMAQKYVDLMVAYTRSEVGSVDAASKQGTIPGPETLLTEELGARKISETAPVKPWEQEKKTQAAKPWESNTSTADSSDWDI